jgi:hypothetical protein
MTGDGVGAREIRESRKNVVIELMCASLDMSFSGLEDKLVRDQKVEHYEAMRMRFSSFALWG